MSKRHPIISITGSSGAGTTTVTATFEHIFRREKIKAQIVEGDAFQHRFDRLEMRELVKEANERGNSQVSHFGPDANLFGEIESLFKAYGETGGGKLRKYLHDEEEARAFQAAAPARSQPWTDVEPGTDLLFYEGLHGGVVDKSLGIDIARQTDLLVGVVPIINLEWIQKLHRDKRYRGYTHEAVVDTILRRMPDYVKYICPQFSETHVNFQRVPTVDTSNPFTRARRADRRREHAHHPLPATPRASTCPTCCRCSPTRSCRAPTRSSAPARRCRWRCSSSSRR